MINAKRLTEIARAFVFDYHNLTGNPSGDQRVEFVMKKLAALEVEAVRGADLPMSLMRALGILAHVHTRESDGTGFVVDIGAVPSPYSPGPIRRDGDYVEAWQVVRQAVGLQT